MANEDETTTEAAEVVNAPHGGVDENSVDLVLADVDPNSGDAERRGKKTPAEFPSDWHFERHLEDLERELLGRKARLDELESMNAHPDVLAQTQAEIDAAAGELARYSGQKAAAKRPARARETRA